MTDEDFLDIFKLPEKTPTSAFGHVVTVDDDIDDEPDISEDDVEDDPEVIEAIRQAEAAKKQAEEAKSEISDVTEKVDAIREQEDEIREQLRELERKLYTLQAERQAITNASAQRRAKVRQAEFEVESATRNISIAKNNALTRRRLTITVEGYQRIAKKFSWYSGITTAEGKTIKCLPHQWEGIKFLATSGRAILGDEMGLGKTLTAIAALDLVKSRRALVICPAEVTSNFLREVKRWAPHRKVVNLNGKSKLERNSILDMAAAFEPVVVIVNYEAWRKDLSLLERLINIQFDTLIADEAHAVKGTNTGAFEGVEKIALSNNTCPYDQSLLVLDEKFNQRACPECNYMAGYSINVAGLSDSERAQLTRSVKNLWMMTGTPILNQPGDLYPMLYLIDPINFPVKSQYLRTYCEMGYDGKYVFKPGGLSSLTKKISGRYLARNLNDAGVELPPQDIIYHNIDFDDDSYLMQQDIIEQLTKHDQIVLAEDNKMSAIGILALITRRRQANVWPAAIEVWEHPKDEFGLPDKSQDKVLVFTAKDVRESIKLDKVVELVEEFRETGNRIAVFSQFKSGLAELEARLNERGVSVVRFDGDTSSALKDRIKRNFDKSLGETPEWEVVLCNYKTGGVGLNLTAATHTIILDEEWNPGKRDQAYARTHRMGQDEQTFVHVLRVNNTVDEWLAALIDEKADLIDGFSSATVDIQKEMLKVLKDGA